MKNIGDSSIQSLTASINNSLLTQRDSPVHESKKDLFKINISKKSGKKIKNRESNSLELLTRKFIQSLGEEKTDIINLKNFAEKINVHKRRIYDITGVLWGK